MAVVDCAPRAVAFGNVAPLRTGVEFPEHAIQDAMVVFPGMADRPAWWQVWLHNRKLLISEFVTSHRWFLLHSCPMTTRTADARPRYRIAGQNLAEKHQ